MTEKTLKKDQEIEAVPFFRKKRVLLPLLGVLAAAVVLTLVWYFDYAATVSTDDAFVDGNRVTVSSKYLGRITQLTVDEGAVVKKGQLLVKLDDADLRAQQEQAKASLRLAEQNETLAGVNLGKAGDDFKRAEAQYRDNIIPKEQYEHAQKALEAARAQKAIAGAQIGAAKAQLGVISTQLLNTEIYAPMDGVVAKRWVFPGDVVQMAQPILSVYDLDNLWVTANLEETKYAAIRPEQKVRIAVDTYNGKEIEGKVQLLGSNTAAQFSLIPPNNASGNFTKVTQRIPIRIAIDNAIVKGRHMQLLPGMSVVVRMKTR